MSGPITPDQVGETKRLLFPQAVFDAFNAEIAATFSSGSAVVLQGKVVDRMIAAGIDRHDIFSKGYLNVEEAYKAEGWSVEYDKPGYNESYEANFTFRRKR